MVQFIGFVSERVRESILASGNQHRSDDMAKATLSEHERILAAIAAGDGALAQKAMSIHLKGAAERVGLTEESQKTRRVRASEDAPTTTKKTKDRTPPGRRTKAPVTANGV
jgi:DNA-binding FadR family transcriptional regulator